MNIHKSVELHLWYIFLPLLVAANLAYFTHNFIGWVITLVVFITIPGYLLLQTLKPGKIARGESLSLSLGLSLAILLFGGLILNSLHAVGLHKPLTTVHIFAFFDTVSCLLLAGNYRQIVTFSVPHIKVSLEQGIVIAVCTLLPFITIGGANRLNNGASNVLILIVMALIAVIFISLPLRPNLKSIYPYAVFMIGMSILFCNSIRGLNITGHDIHHEFVVFQSTFNKDLWVQTGKHGDPYNACLSITILPTIFAKLTTIPSIFIYKTVFQILFASFLPALYYMFKRFASDRKAVLGVFVFMTFPTFTNDLPFLNRQEVAFIFIILLLFVNFMDMAYRAKIFLTFIFLFSIIMSHYSSSYVTLILLLISPIFYKAINYRLKNSGSIRFPLLNTRIILVALLLTFVWNSQITASTGNLRNTVVNTVINLVGPASKRQNFNYSLTQAPTSAKPIQIFTKYAANDPSTIHIIPKQELPVTKFGHAVAHITKFHKPETINVIFHAFLAKVLQLLVVVGTIVMFIRNRKRASSHERYLLALACASLFTLMLFTLLPQLAVDYDVTRLFQQSLMFLWLPSVLLAEQLFFFLGRHRLIGASALFAFLYLNLAGFIPELTGGFPPQLPLNNSGIYYNYFYTHSSDITGTHWLAAHHDKSQDIKFDSGAAIAIQPFKYGVGLVNTGNPGYLYLDYTDTTRDSFRTIIDGVFIEYSNPTVLIDRNKVYANNYAKIYFKHSTVSN